MKQNRASRVNRTIMFGMMFLAVIVLGSVFTFLYLAFQKAGEEEAERQQYAVVLSQSLGGDSLMVVVNDSAIFSGVADADSSRTYYAPGNKEQNMISVVDLSTGATLNENLPDEPSTVIVSDNDGITVETSPRK